MTLAPDAATTQGTVIFVGGGPGNPDLVTVRAREVLAHASRVFADEDVPAAILELVATELAIPQELINDNLRAWEAECAKAKEEGARKIPVRPEIPSAATITILEDTPTKEVTKLLGENTAKGVDIVRLVAGNPLTNDRVLEEISAVNELGLDFQVVPGMPLPSTVSTFAGMAYGSTYTSTDITAGDIDWELLAGGLKPLVLQAREEQLSLITTNLTGLGMDASTPVSVTVNGTTRLQRTFDTTLGTLGKLDGDMPGTLVITIGHSVDDRSKFSWWENRALYGWRVLVPRAAGQAAPMSTRLVTHGAIPQEVPTISVEPPRNPAQMERAVKGIVEGRYQWVVLTSINAVNALWEKMIDFGLDARDFAGITIAAVGHKTAARIRELGISPELTPRTDKQNANGLLEVFPEFDEDLDPVGRVLYPCADIAAPTLAEGLRGLGWEVDDIVAYRTVRAAPPPAKIRDMIKAGGFDAVCFTSPSTVKNLIGIAGKPHQRTIISCIGPTTAAAAEEVGLRVDVVPTVAGVPELVDALAEHVAGLRAAGQLPPPRKKRRARRSSTAQDSKTDKDSEKGKDKDKSADKAP